MTTASPTPSLGSPSSKPGMYWSGAAVMREEIPYSPTVMETKSGSARDVHMAITFMDAYQRVSFEELRLAHIFYDVVTQRSPAQRFRWERAQVVALPENPISSEPSHQVIEPSPFLAFANPASVSSVVNTPLFGAPSAPATPSLAPVNSPIVPGLGFGRYAPRSEPLRAFGLETSGAANTSFGTPAAGSTGSAVAWQGRNLGSPVLSEATVSSIQSGRTTIAATRNSGAAAGTSVGRTTPAAPAQQTQAVGQQISPPVVPPHGNTNNTQPRTGTPNLTNFSTPGATVHPTPSNLHQMPTTPGAASGASAVGNRHFGMPSFTQAPDALGSSDGPLPRQVHGQTRTVSFNAPPSVSSVQSSDAQQNDGTGHANAIPFPVSRPEEQPVRSDSGATYRSFAGQQAYAEAAQPPPTTAPCPPTPIQFGMMDDTSEVLAAAERKWDESRRQLVLRKDALRRAQEEYEQARLEEMQSFTEYTQARLASTSL